MQTLSIQCCPIMYTSFFKDLEVGCSSFACAYVLCSLRSQRNEQQAVPSPAAQVLSNIECSPADAGDRAWHEQICTSSADLGDLRAEIRSVHCLSQPQHVHFKNTTGHHPRGRKEPSRHTKSSLHRTLLVVFAPRWPSRFALADLHLSLSPYIHRTTWKNISAAQMRLSKGFLARSRML